MPNTKNKATQKNNNLHLLLNTIDALRGVGGCPWDQKQTSKSLLKYLKSECDELIDAINNDDTDNICEELGDLLYIILMYSAINEKNGRFTLTDLINNINEKLIRRHPHVFGGSSYKSEEELARQWQAIKAEEKKKNTI